MHIVATIQDRALGDYAERLRRLGADGRVMLATALNVAGGEVRGGTVAAETEQTGLERRTIDRAQIAILATPLTLRFTIQAKGGDVRLRYFDPRETSGGVIAHPFGHDQVFGHAFMKGGRFPDRVTIAKLNGAVIERIGVRGRDTPWSRTVRSGVVIPAEMIKGGTKAAFEAGVATIVATTVVTRLGAMLP